MQCESEAIPDVQVRVSLDGHAARGEIATDQDEGPFVALGDDGGVEVTARVDAAVAGIAFGGCGGAGAFSEFHGDLGAREDRRIRLVVEGEIGDRGQLWRRDGRRPSDDRGVERLRARGPVVDQRGQSRAVLLRHLCIEEHGEHRAIVAGLAYEPPHGSVEGERPLTAPHLVVLRDRELDRVPDREVRGSSGAGSRDSRGRRARWSAGRARARRMIRRRPGGRCAVRCPCRGRGRRADARSRYPRAAGSRGATHPGAGAVASRVNPRRPR